MSWSFLRFRTSRVNSLPQQGDIKEFKQATILNPGRIPEVNISHTRPHLFKGWIAVIHWISHYLADAMQAQTPCKVTKWHYRLVFSIGRFMFGRGVNIQRGKLKSTFSGCPRHPSPCGVAVRFLWLCLLLARELSNKTASSTKAKH